MWRLLVGLYSRPFSLQSSRKLVKARDTERGALRRLLSAISTHKVPHVCFCPSLTPLRFLTTLGRGGKQHCGNFLTTDPSHVVIAEARAHTRYGTGSVVAVGYPRSPHIAVISTSAGSHICSSDSCDGKALAHVFVVRQAHQPCKNCDSAQFSRQQ